MGELYDMDIKGKPLAYTPFCDNNKEMDGYRFWRQVDTYLLPLPFFLLALFFFLSSNSGKGHCLLCMLSNFCYYNLFYCFSLLFCEIGFLERTFTGETISHKVCSGLFHFWISWS